MTDRKMTSQLRVGFVGLGDIGEPMARRVIEAGFPMTLWARREETLRPFQGANFSRAEDLPALGRESDVVGVAVFDDEDVREVISGDNGILAGMAAGGIILIHSTVFVRTVKDLETKCAASGVTVMDVAVSGFRAGAESGQLTVMVGGPREAFERVRPVLDSFGSRIEHLGPLGSGLQMKALNQALMLANFNAAALALLAGRDLGLDPDVTAGILGSSTGSSMALRLITSRLQSDPDLAGRATRIAEKDYAVFDSVRQAAGLELPELSSIAAAAAGSVSRLLQAR
ncbi:MAG TPA: NAD(P)-dependent oxidoreductase [Trebonia sp.]|nr:NAD(P)-dependent oxidoreductase [Trebonia sp.]